MVVTQKRRKMTEKWEESVFPRMYGREYRMYVPNSSFPIRYQSMTQYPRCSQSKSEGNGADIAMVATQKHREITRNEAKWDPPLQWTSQGQERV